MCDGVAVDKYVTVMIANERECEVKKKTHYKAKPMIRLKPGNSLRINKN